jgi:hypothetical protein
MSNQSFQPNRFWSWVTLFLALSSLGTLAQDSSLKRLDSVLQDLSHYEYGEPETWKPELIDVMRGIYSNTGQQAAAKKKLSEFLASQASAVAKKEVGQVYYNLTGEAYTGNSKTVSKQITKPQSPLMVEVAKLDKRFHKSKDQVALIKKELGKASDEFRPHVIRLVKFLPESFKNGSSLLALKNLNPHDKAQLLILLAARHDPSIHDTAIAYLKGNDPQLKIAALKVLHLVGKAEDIDYLTSLAAKADEPYQALARDALSRIPGADIDQSIVTGLSSSTPEEKAELIQAIEKRNTTNAWPALVKLSGSESLDLRIESIRALAMVAPVTGLKDVIDLMVQTDNSKVKSEIEKAIYRIAVRSADNSTAAKVIQAYQRSSNDETIKESLAGILKKLKSD